MLRATHEQGEEARYAHPVRHRLHNLLCAAANGALSSLLNPGRGMVRQRSVKAPCQRRVALLAHHRLRGHACVMRLAACIVRVAWLNAGAACVADTAVGSVPDVEIVAMRVGAGRGARRRRWAGRQNVHEQDEQDHVARTPRPNTFLVPASTPHRSASGSVPL